MSKEVTLNQLLEAVEALKAKMPNGELTIIKNDVEELREYYQAIKQDLSDIKLKLLNPENGVIVRSNQHRDKIASLNEEVDGLFDTVSTIDDDVKELKTFKKTVNTALYVVYVATVGLIVNAIKDVF